MTGSRHSKILAVESAIGGGSIAVFIDGSRAGGVVGASSLSRAEDLLPNLDRILSETGIDKSELSEIVVSAGPGSFTGIKIGLASALGLGASLGIPVRRISLLEALACSQPDQDELAAALPVGRETICWQPYSGNQGLVTPACEPEAVDIEQFHAIILASDPAVFAVDHSIYDVLPEPLRRRCRNAGDDLASILARAAIDYSLIDSPEPIFVGKRK